MTESDSSTPQKVAALASAIKAVCQSIGFGSELDLLVYSCLPPTDPSAVPRDGSLEDARKEVLAAAAKFVEAVDTAERLLNAIPVKDLEPLSPYTDGVRWDVETRRKLKEIQAIIFVLRNPSTDLDDLFSKHGIFGKAKFEKMQSELEKSHHELRKRIFDLQCLPDDQSDPTNPIIDQRRVHKEPVANPNGIAKSDGDSDELSSKTEKPTETDDKPPNMTDESPPPKYDPNSADWILSETLCKVLDIKASTIVGYRKPRECGEDTIDEF